MTQADAGHSRVAPVATTRPVNVDIDTAIYDLRNATRVLSCVVAYHLEYPKGPPQRSDYNQHTQNFDLDPITILTATERVAEMVEDLFEVVCDPIGPKRRSLKLAWQKATEDERASFLQWAGAGKNAVRSAHDN